MTNTQSKNEIPVAPEVAEIPIADQRTTDERDNPEEAAAAALFNETLDTADETTARIKQLSSTILAIPVLREYRGSLADMKWIVSQARVPETVLCHLVELGFNNDPETGGSSWRELEAMIVTSPSVTPAILMKLATSPLTYARTFPLLTKAALECRDRDLLLVLAGIQSGYFPKQFFSTRIEATTVMREILQPILDYFQGVEPDIVRAIRGKSDFYELNAEFERELRDARMTEAEWQAEYQRDLAKEARQRELNNLRKGASGFLGRMHRQ